MEKMMRVTMRMGKAKNISRATSHCNFTQMADVTRRLAMMKKAMGMWSAMPE